ncbi:MAG: cupin domain-containing protein [Campylobacteraceae bacterium]|nr:cupin domain-containing protein [Campylobacteraceae bacterium]
MDKSNIFENIKIDKTNEQFFELLNNDKVRVEKIVSNGQTTPSHEWYDQDETEFVLLLEGYAIIEFEDKEVELHKGDYLIIEKHIRHRVKYTSKKEPCIWLALFY